MNTERFEIVADWLDRNKELAEFLRDVLWTLSAFKPFIKDQSKEMETILENKLNSAGNPCVGVMRLSSASSIPMASASSRGLRSHCSSIIRATSSSKVPSVSGSSAPLKWWAKTWSNISKCRSLLIKMAREAV